MAETRDTQVLEDVVESTEIENPRTTEEAILAKIIAREEVDINARTRYQAYLKELGSISGGNPNYVETITGTLANPWGDINPDELCDSILSNDANAYFEFTLGPKSGYGPISAQHSGSEIPARLIAFRFADIYSDGVETAVEIVYQNGELSYAYLASGGVVQDMIQYAQVVSTQLTVTYHPLPESSD